ncbi:MAG: bifunctional phosphoribosylaminoimidazolecarboxamide formyltransferase/IMP cyclohydrolase [Alphaproteobacteria bacterium]|nr:bifunctional phosphoribosylaminoimidazolecarboxamide formyltransferase/IMP cyclohydrolase [Alphaproteobacteria bacterium]
MAKSVKPPIRRALISVADKTGIVELAQALTAAGVEIISTGGTHKALAAENIPAIEVAEFTGSGEILGGRVKTLHPKIHGGLLALRNDDAHKSAMRIHQIAPIDLLVVNLYPFAEVVARGAHYDEVIENIDIGGPAMIRAAAKNHAHVTVVVDPGDYEEIAQIVGRGQRVNFSRRQMLAAKAFALTAHYDAGISNWFSGVLDFADVPHKAVSGRLKQVLRYGENPHQSARFYVTGTLVPGVATASQIQGKDLSYNNINDTDAAFELVAEFPADQAVVAIVKHANPCGVGLAQTPAEAYDKALACDPVSAFGGIVATNQTIDVALAERIVKIFTEVVIAPDATSEAKAVFLGKPKLRLLLAGGLPDRQAPGTDVRSVSGGFLLQSRDTKNVQDAQLQTVSKRAPDETELADLHLAAIVAKHVKSNAIVFVKDGATVGIGAGQMSRVDATAIAARKARETAKSAGRNGSPTKGSVAASDAFFPFADGLEAVIAAGATAVIQPGGSIRDDEVIATADAAGIAMVFTGMRHFRH